MIENDGARVNRRNFLCASALGSVSLAPIAHAWESRAATNSQGDVSSIFLFMTGGMSHLDLWDPKPEAPAEIRGEFRPIDTAVPGIRISSLLPRIAHATDKLAILRSMTHGKTEHAQASAMMTPGWPMAGQDDRAAPHDGLPVIIDTTVACSGPLFEAVSREPEAMQRQYGSTDLGRSCLWARTRVEAGCRFVGIRSGHWDTHRRNSWCLKELLTPAFDQALAALLDDLSGRGLLESTLVIVATEFGRTPRVNSQAGRDHWPSAFSMVLAGGGVRPGQVVGATDRHGAVVADRPVTPHDLEATIRHLLGIGVDTGLDPRSFSISAARPIGELIV